MHVNSIDINSGNLFIQNTNKLKINDGDVIRAKISEKAGNKISLCIGKETVTALYQGDFSGQVGDELLFSVSKVKDSYTFKLVTESSEDAPAGAGEMKVSDLFAAIAKQMNFFAKEEDKSVKGMIERQVEAHKKTMAALAGIKQQLGNCVNKVNASAVNVLVANGISLNKIGIHILSNVIAEIDAIDKTHISSEEFDSAIKDYMGSNRMTDYLDKCRGYSKILSAQGLPTTSKNLKTLETAEKMLEAVQSLDEDGVLDLLDKNVSFHLDSVYKFKFSRTGHGSRGTLPDETVENLIPEIMKTFERDNIEKNDENFSIAKLLVKNNVSLHKNNIENFIHLRDANFNLQAILNQTAKNIRADKETYQIDLFQTLMQRDGNLNEVYNQVIADLPEIDLRTIQIALKRQTPLTISHLQNVLHEKGERNFSNNQNEQASYAALEAKKKLEQIRLALTYEAKLRLIGKNISIDVMPLQEALRQMEQVEKEIYASHLKLNEADPSSENIKKMHDFFKYTKGLKPFYADVIQREPPLTVERLSKANSEASETYAILATKVNSKFKDTVPQKEYQHILQNLGIKVNYDTLAAVKILSKSQLPVTEENIHIINAMNLKINELTKTLTPFVCASMIKEGLDPSQMHIDHALAYTRKFREKFSQSGSEKIAEGLLALEKDHTLTPAQREGVVAVYRMLNEIVKEDKASVGLVVKSGKEATFGNLLDASHYYAKTKGREIFNDITVDDNFGESQLETSRNNIRHILNKAYVVADSEAREEAKALLARSLLGDTHENLETASFMEKEGMEMNENNLYHFHYNENLLKNIMLEMSTQAWADMTDRFKNLDSVPLSTVYKELIEKEYKADAKNFMQDIKKLENASPSLVKWMEEEGIERNIANISLAGVLTKEPFYLGKRLNQMMKENKTAFKHTLEKVKNMSSRKEIFNTIITEAKQLKIQTNAPEIAGMMDEITAAAPIQYKLNHSAPISYKNKFADLTMYVINDKNIQKGEEITALISLETDNLSQVQMRFTLKEKEAEVYFMADEAHALSAVKANEPDLKRMLKSAGISLKNASYESDEKDKKESEILKSEAQFEIVV